MVGELIFAAVSSLVLGFAWHRVAEGGFSALVCILATVAGTGALYSALDAFTDLQLPFAGEFGALVMLPGVVTTWLRAVKRPFSNFIPLQI